MAKIIYNPFDKGINELQQADLEILIEKKICEGWYIEYKGMIPLNKKDFDRTKIAKSISSFANTKGGWIFWGIDCSINEPTQLTGIDISVYRNFQDTVSQIISSNISPTPIFHFREVKLNNGLIVFVIQVEESPLPPYITSQGVIYQREHNESKPIQERYVLEKLSEKASDYRNTIEKFSNFDLGQTKGQSESTESFLELYLFPKPFNSFDFSNFYKSEFFKEIATRFYQALDIVDEDRSYAIPVNLGFNSIYSTGHSVVIRALSDKNMIFKSTIAELSKNGNLKFNIQINSFMADRPPVHYKDSKVLNYLLDKYSPMETVKDYGTRGLSGKYMQEPMDVQRRKESNFVNIIQLIDGFELIMYILIIVEKYKSVMTDNGFDMGTEIGVRARVKNAFRKFVFFDDDDYLEKLKLYNIPLSSKNQIEMPEFRNGASYGIRLNEKGISSTISHLVIEGIGLPDSSTIKFAEIFKKGLERFEKKFKS